MAWKTEYKTEFLRRLTAHQRIADDPQMRIRVMKYYATHCIEWINDWCITFDPRVEPPLPKMMPFQLFPRQRDFVQFVLSCLHDKEDGLCEKSRDMGITWLCCCIAVWLWIFHAGSVVGFGSVLAHNIDDRGNPKSIFLKVRQIIANLPWWMRPPGYIEKWHAPAMKVLHPSDRWNSSIIGEGGINVGRGGRTSLYFKDEALTLSSRVLTMEGYKIMGDLNMNDRVISIKGTPQKITHINDCGEFETYIVTLNDGTAIECSPHHLWTLNEVIGVSKQVTIRTEEVFERYKYVSPNGQIQYRFRLPLIDAVRFIKKKLPLHPYVVGALIGDGGVSQVPHHSPKFTSIDSEIVEYFTVCLPDYCTIKAEGKMGYRLGDVRGRMGWKHKSRIRKVIVDIGLAGKRSWEKSIPDIYKYSSVNDRLELLQGLMDTDGSAGKSGGSAAYYTSSRQLADDVRFLAESLGGYATMKIKKDKRGFRDQYVVFVVLPEKFKPFKLKRKLDIYAKRKNSVERSIVSVVKIGKKQPVRCITVDSKEGIYLTEGCSPTHNSAHYEQPELIEASLSENTNVQIDISSVNGTANPFYKRRMAGEIWYPDRPSTPGLVRVFIFDWRDNPLKSVPWYEKRKAKFDREGLAHIFAQEVDRDYSGSQERIIIPAEWVNAAVDAHIKLNMPPSGLKIAGQDVADGGGDKNAIAIRHGVVLIEADHWGGQADDAPGIAIPICKELGVNELYYDSIGVGAGFKAAINNMKRNDLTYPKLLKVYPWDAGAEVLDPEKRIIPGDKESPLNKDQYANMKAQAWFRLRARFSKTYRMLHRNETYPPDELVSLDSTLKRLHEIKTELSQPQSKTMQDGKTLVDKKPDGSTSPNLADAICMCYCPAKPPAGLFS